MKTHYAASVCSTSIKDINLDNSKGRLCLLVVFFIYLIRQRWDRQRVLTSPVKKLRIQMTYVSTLPC